MPHHRHPHRRAAAVALLTPLTLLVGLSAAPVARPQAAAADASAAAPAYCGATLAADEVLRRVNAVRARGAVCGSAGPAVAAGTLRWSAGLASVAAAQAESMAARHKMSHRDAQDRGLTARLAAHGYRFNSAVENVAVGYSSIDAVVDAWLVSETHCVNLMKPAAIELGLACSDATPDGEAEVARYWDLVLANPLAGPAAR